MDKIRVYELANELGISSKDLIALLDSEFDIHVKNHMSQVEEGCSGLVKTFLNKENCKDFTLSSIYLRNIKQFKRNHFDFNNSASINTISGRNGSGKSTLFKCLTFVQKAFFIELFKEQSNYSSLRISLGQELFSFFNGTDSCIEIEFKKDYANIKDTDEDSEYNSVVIGLSAENIVNEIINWKLICSDRDYRFVNRFWNLSNPKNIIIFIESFKEIVEEDIKYDNINIRDEKVNYSPIVDIILNQDQIYNQLYKNLINDYLYYRLVPPEVDSRRDIYYHITKVLFKHLFPNIDLKKFSGKVRSEQFILLAKNGNKELFDIRNFSSGEKLVFYLLLFINCVRSLGILIIDEVENHLHEEVACKFLYTLSEICTIDNFVDYIIKKSKALKYTSDQQAMLKRNISNNYCNFKINQIFLLTHSKSLIYANFGEGKNFIITDRLQELSNDCEKELRDIGISYIYERVVFVEGKTDCDILRDRLNSYNIKVRKLGNCTEVINTYKKLLNAKEFTRDSKYVFLIDKDNREEDEIENLRRLNPDYFDDAFICLDRHEMENYFLEPRAILKVINKFNEQISIDEGIISKDLYEIATENKYASKRKYLNYYIDMKLESLRCLVNIKDIDKVVSDNEEFYKRYIYDKIINNSSIINLDKELIKIYDDCSRKYSDEVWSSQWKNLCDGKIVFNHYTAKYAKAIGLTNEYFRRNIIKEVMDDSESDFNKMVNNIIQRLS